MKTDIPQLVALYKFPGARVISTLRQVAEAIARFGDASLSPIEEHVGRALKHALAVRALEDRFVVSRAGPTGNPRLVVVDGHVDRVVTAVRDVAQARVDAGGDENDPIPALAQELLRDCFPNGVQAITQTSFVEELSLVESMLAKIKARHTEAIEKLGLTRLVARLAKLMVVYRHEHDAVVLPSVDFTAVRTARERRQRMLLEVVAMIMGRFPLDIPEHTRARAALLGPVIAHNDAIGEMRRARRAGESDEPDGEELATTDDEGDAEEVSTPALAAAPE